MTELTELEKLQAIIADDFKAVAYDDAEGFANVTDEAGEARRWSRTVTTIVRAEATGNLYAFDWEQGLTEMQEDECYSPNVRQVERRERTVTVVDYVEVTA